MSLSDCQGPSTPALPGLALRRSLIWYGSIVTRSICASGSDERVPLAPLTLSPMPTLTTRSSSGADTQDGTFERSDFTYDHRHDLYTCPGGRELRHYHRRFSSPRQGVDQDGFMRYRATELDCDPCSLKAGCCPNAPARKILRSIHEGARDMARAIATTDAYARSHRQRKKVEMLFAHVKRILRLNRLRLRGPNGARDELIPMPMPKPA